MAESTKKAHPACMCSDDQQLDQLRDLYAAHERTMLARADRISRDHQITKLAAGMVLRIYGDDGAYTALVHYKKHGTWPKPGDVGKEQGSKR